MNPVVLYFASGESLYSGAALFLILVGLTPFVRNRWFMRLRTLLLWISLAMMVMACPPLPYWLDGVFFAAIVFWFMVWSGMDRPPTAGRRRLRLAASMLLIALGVLLPVLEVPWRICPSFTGTPGDHLVVIGDSISAGIFRDQPWPDILQSHSGVGVRNLSRAGDETSDALDQCRKLTPADTLVLIEIGGNDLLGGVSAAEFATRLDKLLTACVSPKRTLIMFELPLLPHRIGYGRAQRRLAAEYHVQLIPKRYFVAAFRAGTSDGLHLSPAGARRMAELVEALLHPLFTKPEPPVTLPQSVR
jgi:lysophospholipase L1-like esterase